MRPDTLDKTVTLASMASRARMTGDFADGETMSSAFWILIGTSDVL
jgi:hypothetical protein